MGTLKSITPKFSNTAGQRAGMHTGKASAQPVHQTHNAGFTYAQFAKANPAPSGKGKK
jgi:hypothetical protein